jgi:hypothetical protein
LTPHTASGTATIGPAVGPGSTHQLLESLSAAVLGRYGSDSCIEQATGYHDAFAETADVRHLDLGGGLRALPRGQTA